MTSPQRKLAVFCETQPITADGLRVLVDSSSSLRFAGSAASLDQASELVRMRNPDLILLDKALGLQAILDWVLKMKAGFGAGCEVAVWGNAITESEALRLLQAGVKGLVRKTSDSTSVLNCLEAVSTGATWMADCVFREVNRLMRGARTDLTGREQQVMELVEQGLKNREIARELGIRPGTVKIHLKHIFEKTGVRGRYGLALTAMKHRGLLEVSDDETPTREQPVAIEAPPVRMVS